MNKDAGIHKDQLKDKRLDHDDGDDSDDSSISSSTSIQTKNSGNSWFDPPIDNYRFYYQGGGVGTHSQLGSQLGYRKSFGGSISGSLDRKSDNNRAAGLILKKQRSSIRNID